jgi:hypothetical protein
MTLCVYITIYLIVFDLSVYFRSGREAEKLFHEEICLASHNLFDFY